MLCENTHLNCKLVFFPNEMLFSTPKHTMTVVERIVEIVEQKKKKTM